MAAFPPLFLKVRSKGNAHRLAQVQAQQLTWAAREQREKGHRDDMWGQGAVNQSRTPHSLLCIWQRNQLTPGLQEAPMWWSQHCEPGTAARHGGSWSVPKGWREMFSSPGYLVHLDGSLCPLQRNGVGLLQPLGHSFLEPLVEIAQSQRSIPVDEGTSFSSCTATAQAHHPSLLSYTRNCPKVEATGSTTLRRNFPLSGS